MYEKGASFYKLVTDTDAESFFFFFMKEKWERFGIIPLYFGVPLSYEPNAGFV